jgi:hypothetical protein
MLVAATESESALSCLLSLIFSHVLSTTCVPKLPEKIPVPIAPERVTTHTSEPDPMDNEGEIADGGGWSSYLIVVSAAYTIGVSMVPTNNKINKYIHSLIIS